MITSKNRITRRTLLRGASGVSIGLPFLSAMLEPGRSHAQENTPTRFVVFYTPGGTLLDKWRPTGSESDFALQPMLQPLAAFKDRLLFVDGTDLSITQIGAGHPHSRGMSGILTGQQLLPGELVTNGGGASFADGPSIDQVIANQISSQSRFKSLEVSTGWSTGISMGGQPHPANTITFAGSLQPLPPASDPLQTFKRVFSDVGADAEANLAWNQSILDALGSEYVKISQVLGAEDRAKLEAHLAEIRDIEMRLSAGVANTCTPPTNVNPTPGYYEDGEVDVSSFDPDGGVNEGAKVPEKGNVMTDLLVSALACDLTRVGTMQWGDSEAKFLMNFLADSSGEPLADHHHGYQHDRGFQPEALEVIYHWYAGNLAHLLERMDSIQEGNGQSLLDNSIVFHVTELQHPESHGQTQMPLLLAGKAGGALRSGQHLQVPSQPHNNLLVSLLNLYGVDVTTFGHPDFCTGPLAGLA